MTKDYTLTELSAEVRRVFGPAEVRYEIGDEVSVLVADWPERQLYTAPGLMEVLAKQADGAGLTEDGDASICRTLELAGTHRGSWSDNYRA